MINEHRLEVTVLSAAPKLSQTGPEPSVLLSPACVGGVCWNGVIARIVDAISIHERCSRGPKTLYLRFFSGSEARKIKRLGCRLVSEALNVGSGVQAIVKICVVVQFLLVACPACRPSGWWPGPNIVAWHFYHPSAQSEINLASRQPWQPPAILSHSRQSGSVGWAKPGRAGRGIGAR